MPCSRPYVQGVPSSKMLRYACLRVNATTSSLPFHQLRHLRTTVITLLALGRLGRLGFLGSFHLREEGLRLRSASAPQSDH